MIELLESAYLLLLQIPHDNPLRVRAESTLAALRDAIADNNGLSSEVVQNDFEAMADIEKQRPI
jgi:hypothetical protein